MILMLLNGEMIFIFDSLALALANSHNITPFHTPKAPLYVSLWAETGEEKLPNGCVPLSFPFHKISLVSFPKQSRPVLLQFFKEKEIHRQGKRKK